ncbi:MAG: PhoH family protein [Candidatus Fermentibacteraceae bacterium]
MKPATGRRIPLPPEDARHILGPGDVHLREICRELRVSAVFRDSTLVVSGSTRSLDRAQATVERLLSELRSCGSVSSAAVAKAMEFPGMKAAGIVMDVPGRSGRIVPRSPGQEQYIKAMLSHELVFGIGPAGTGKTFLAVAAAVSALRDGRVERIILTRPAVEAGENLGFLPGDLQQKIDPYLRPIYDSLDDTLTPAGTARNMEAGIIEVAPLAYMRGRTLNNSFVILDEAQNTTLTQLKMFLTRMGYGSRLVVTGDVTQIDLKPSSASGLVRIQKVLRQIPGVAFIYLEKEDVVRHPLVQRIIEAFGSSEENDG